MRGKTTKARVMARGRGSPSRPSGSRAFGPRFKKLIEYIKTMPITNHLQGAPDVMEYLEQARQRTVKSKSYEGYMKHAVYVFEDQGSLSWEAFVRHCRTHSHLSPATLAQRKSGLAKVLEVYNRGFAPEQDQALNDVVKGLYSLPRPPTPGEVAKPTHRGAITLEKLTQLMQFMREQGDHDAALAAYVAFHAVLRPQDIDCAIGLNIGTLEDGFTYFMAKRKESSQGIYTLGRFEAHPVNNAACAEVLLDLKKRVGDHENLFGDFTSAKGCEYVAQAAAAFGWDPRVQWTGFHNIRHGAGQQAIKQAYLDASAASAAWKGTACRTYAGFGRQHPVNIRWFDRFNLGLEVN